jgi:2-dehydro-3-deoxyphosphogluconate aldolase/(4S)-4-hydroxy-2-oxoglutarate aldolase
MKGELEMEQKGLGFEVMHVGINCKDAGEASKTAEVLKNIFGFESSETPVSFFSTKKIEIMKKNGAGERGHIAIGTNDIHAAVKYLEGRGYGFNQDSAAYFPDGRLKLIYLKDEIAGFAFHLLQK